jgi:cytochrome c553
MKRSAVFLAMTAFITIAAGILAAQQSGSAVPPPWAYGFATPPGAAVAAPAGGGGGGGGGARGGGGAAPAPDTTPQKLAGTTLTFTLAQIRDGYGPADWFPGDHPTMPEIVAHGKRDQQVTACALCHYPNGKGRPENAGIAGLPYAYFVQQMMDFRNGDRNSADSRKTNTSRMAAFAKAMTDDEIKASATYFASLKGTPWVRVVETDTVPKTRISAGMFVALDGEQAGKEPIGQRIVEVPENGVETDTLRNPRSPFVAYVPQGSIKKGEVLVTNGGGKTTACAVCHGTDLQGLGPVPGIAGRSPSYMVRQLFDMQQGTRKGLWSDLMKPVVTKLTTEEILNIAAYLASRGPAPDSRRAQ